MLKTLNISGGSCLQPNKYLIAKNVNHVTNIEICTYEQLVRNEVDRSKKKGG